MTGGIRNFAVAMIFTLKVCLSTFLGVSIMASMFGRSTRGMVENLASAGVLLFGIALPGLWVLGGWLTNKDGGVMRRRRVLALKTEMVGGGVMLLVPNFVSSRKDFNVGHGQEYVLIYFLFAFLILSFAQFNRIPFGAETDEGKEDN
jgi:hypothetical protein